MTFTILLHDDSFSWMSHGWLVVYVCRLYLSVSSAFSVSVLKNALTHLGVFWACMGGIHLFNGNHCKQEQGKYDSAVHCMPYTRYNLHLSCITLNDNDSSTHLHSGVQRSSQWTIYIIKYSFLCWLFKSFMWGNIYITMAKWGLKSNVQSLSKQTGF